MISYRSGSLKQRSNTLSKIDKPKTSLLNQIITHAINPRKIAEKVSSKFKQQKEKELKKEIENQKEEQFSLQPLPQKRQSELRIKTIMEVEEDLEDKSSFQLTKLKDDGSSPLEIITQTDKQSKTPFQRASSFKSSEYFQGSCFSKLSNNFNFQHKVLSKFTPKNKTNPSSPSVKNLIKKVREENKKLLTDQFDNYQFPPIPNQMKSAKIKTRYSPIQHKSTNEVKSKLLSPYNEKIEEMPKIGNEEKEGDQILLQLPKDETPHSGNRFRIKPKPVSIGLSPNDRETPITIKVKDFMKGQRKSSIVMQEIPAQYKINKGTQQNLVKEIKKIDKEDLITRFPHMVNIAKEREIMRCINIRPTDDQTIEQDKNTSVTKKYSNTTSLNEDHELSLGTDSDEEEYEMEYDDEEIYGEEDQDSSFYTETLCPTLSHDQEDNSQITNHKSNNKNFNSNSLSPKVYSQKHLFKSQKKQQLLTPKKQKRRGCIYWKISKQIKQLHQLTFLVLLTPENLKMLESQFSPIKKPTKNKSITTLSVTTMKRNGKKKINQYTVIKQIGICLNEKDNKYYAMKVINKRKLGKKLFHLKTSANSMLESEMAILKKLDHPNVLNLYEILDDSSIHKLYLITELAQNGNLKQKFEELQEQGKLMPIESVRKYFRQLISAVEYCHKCANIVHRDIKPENILIDENDNAKLADFGLSQIMENGAEDVSETCGSNLFFSPEACKGKKYNGRSSDIWACGVTLYYMSFNSMPFSSTNIQELFLKIRNEEPLYPPNSDPNLVDLLKKFFIKDPEQRIGIEEIKDHSWVTKNGQEPMPSLQQSEISITEKDMKSVFTKVRLITRVMLNLQKTQSGFMKNRKASMLTPTVH